MAKRAKLLPFTSTQATSYELKLSPAIMRFYRGLKVGKNIFLLPKGRCSIKKNG